MPARFYYKNPDAPFPEKIGVGALALIEHDEKVLLELRSDCNLWGLPGGAVEPHEEIEDALRREVFEETNLVVKSHELFGVYSDASRIAAFPDGNVVRLISFVYRVEAEDISLMHASEESLDLRFFRREELPALDLVATAIPAIEDLLSV